MLAVAEAIGEVAEPTAVALSQFEDLGAAALSQCAAQAIGAAIAVTGTGATAVQRRSAQPLSARPPSVQLRRGPTAAAATTLTATGFAINPVPAPIAGFSKRRHVTQRESLVPFTGWPVNT
jgi:hypothetical protein